MTDPLKSQQNNVLQSLREAHEQLQGNDERVSRLVAAARELGSSWRSIGAVLGVSKQAAWERYGKSDPHPVHSKPPKED
jgi:hypothetical protein